MSLQLYQVDQKNYLLDFKSLDIADHPDAARVKRMTIASMTGSGDEPSGACCITLYLSVCICQCLSVYQTSLSKVASTNHLSPLTDCTTCLQQAPCVGFVAVTIGPSPFKCWR